MEKTFEDSALWRHAHKFVLGAYTFTEQFPSSEAHGLTPRIRKAAALIAVNIAEGLKSEAIGGHRKAYFLGISQSMVEECRRHFTFANYLGYGHSYELQSQLEELEELLQTSAPGIPIPS